MLCFVKLKITFTLFVLICREEIMISDTAEEVMLVDMDPNQQRRDSRKQYDFDESCGNRVQCAPH